MAKGTDGTRGNQQLYSSASEGSNLEPFIKLNAYVLSAKDLGLLDSYNVSGYHIQDWITDLKLKYEILNRKEQEQKLKTMESKLDKLLSDDK